MTRSGYVLAAASRAGCLAVVILDENRIVEVRRRRYDDYATNPGKVNRLILEVAHDYQPALLVVEPRTKSGGIANSYRIFPRVRRIGLEEAKRLLLGDRGRRSHRHLFHHLVREHPELNRFVTVLNSTGRVAMCQRRRTVVLVAVALGLAAQQRRPRCRRWPQGRPATT